MGKTENLLSKRLLKGKDNQFSKPIVRLSVAGISICLIIIIVALSITTGYKQAIENKVVDMGAHIRISNYDLNYSFAPKPFDKNQPFLQNLKSNPDIETIQYFSTKVGIVKVEDQVEGIVLKGVDSTFSWEHFNRNMVEGSTLHVSDSQVCKGVLMSKLLAQKLKLKIGDKVFAYFVQDPPMQRRFILEGIFETGMPEYDERFIIADLRHVQKLNGWDSNYVGGIELLIKDYDKIDEVGEFVNNHIGYQLKAETIKQIYPQIFQWTELFDTNVMVLLAITIFICIVTLTSTFFIIILEQTPNIGILKSMGMTTRRVRKIFMLIGLRIILQGIIIGNAIAIGLCLLQKYWHIIKLDASSYYVDSVPISFNVPVIIAVNIDVFALCLLVLLIPSTFVAKKTSTISAIQFD